MTDDVSWFWAGEHGRDQILRDSVDDLHAQLSASSRRSSRLSSQLAALQGSMEARLSALSVAFDAYVELGDIREQLSGYPDTSQIRREVRDALTAAAQGRPAEPIDARELSYWLPYATNAVLSLAAGTGADGAADTARSLSPDSELFMVAAAGATGHGAAVRDRVPGLLIGDGTLSAAQIALLRGACAGLFGDPAVVVGEIESVLQPALTAVPAADWTRWVRRQAGDSPVARVEWIRDLVAASAGPPTGPAPESTPQLQLQAVVSELAGRGLGDEAELLRRAKELRRRIEAPNQSPARDDQDAEPLRRPVVEVVRECLLREPGDSAARPVLLGWLASPLSAELALAETEAAQPPGFTQRVTSAAGAVEVGPQGADPGLVEERLAKLRSLQPAPIWLYGFAAATALAVVLAVVLLVIGNRTAAVLLFFLGGAGVIGVLYQVRESRAVRRETAANLTRLQTEIGEARTAAQAAEQDWRTRLEQTRRLVADVRSGLSAGTTRR